VNDAIVATAPANLSSLGRITAQWGNSALMNLQGTGKIFQHLQTADLLAKRSIQTRSTLFDVSEVKGGYIRDRLYSLLQEAVVAATASEASRPPGPVGSPFLSCCLREAAA
jgi:hypothetical protein